MREHEVPTHVQAEDRVLLWFTFPQIVAMTAVCALSYGVYRYAPVGPSEVRMALAVLFGLFGIAMVAGKIGGRRLPLVAADLLRYRLGPRRYVGPVSQLVRNEAPAQKDTVPSPLSLLAMRFKRNARRLSGMMESARRRIRRRKRSGGNRQSGRMPFRPHRWFRRRRDQKVNDGGNDTNSSPSKKSRGRKFPRLWAAALAVALAVGAVSLPQGVFADDDWRDEIDFELIDPVPGRRLFVEGLTVTGDTAAVTLRAATDLRISVHAYGGRLGIQLLSWATAQLMEGESIAYELPLEGSSPSFTFSWEDSLGQAGAFSLRDGQIPYPLPTVEGEICDLSLVSLGWTPGTVEGVVESECEDRVKKTVALQTVAGHVRVAEMSLMDADVTAVTGVVSAVTTGSRTAVPLVPNGKTSFRLEAGREKKIHPVVLVVETEASLSIPLPPLTRLTHHTERTQHYTRTVTLTRPGVTRTVSKRVTVEHDDGATTEHTVSATLSISSREIRRDVTVSITHPEHVKAEVEARAPAVRSRTETLDMSTSIGSDESYLTFILPDRKLEIPPAEQRPAGSGEAGDWFEQLGWEWPW